MSEPEYQAHHYAYFLVQRIGGGTYSQGVQRIKNHFNLAETTVRRWCLPRGQSGGVGYIPAVWIRPVVELAYEVESDPDLFSADTLWSLLPALDTENG